MTVVQYIVSSHILSVSFDNFLMLFQETNQTTIEDLISAMNNFCLRLVTIILCYDEH